MMAAELFFGKKKQQIMCTATSAGELSNRGKWRNI
jgi:hypothetical protein